MIFLHLFCFYFLSDTQRNCKTEKLQDKETPLSADSCILQDAQGMKSIEPMILAHSVHFPDSTGVFHTMQLNVISRLILI